MKKEVVELVVQTIFDQTLNFLLSFGSMEGGQQPIFSQPYTDPGFTNPIVYGQPWKRSDPFFYVPPTSGDKVKEAYEAVQRTLQVISSRQLEGMIMREIPDSAEFALVDIGSGTGNRFTNEFAESHSRVSVIMIDEILPQWLEEDSAYRSIHGEHGRLRGFTKRITLSGNPENDLNELLQANGLRNSRYVHGKLKEGLENQLDNIPEIKGKNVTITGFRNPAGLGYLTLQQIRLNAQQGFVTMSAPEKIKKSDGAFQTVVRQLAGQVTIAAVDNYHELLRNEQRYQDECAGRFGVMLKQLMCAAQVLSLPDQWSSKLVYIPPINGVYNYNQPSHVIEVRQ